MTDTRPSRNLSYTVYQAELDHALMPKDMRQLLVQTLKQLPKLRRLHLEFPVKTIDSWISEMQAANLRLENVKELYTGHINESLVSVFPTVTHIAMAPRRNHSYHRNELANFVRASSTTKQLVELNICGSWDLKLVQRKSLFFESPHATECDI